jgi:cbb3-type cytochrome oxidase subunit 3
MRNPGAVKLDQVIVHMLNPEGRGLVTSERALLLNDELRT